MESNTFYDIYLEELKNLPQHAGGGSGASEKN